MEKETVKKDKQKMNGKTVVCFLAGVLLSTVLSIMSVLAVLPGENAAKTDNEIDQAVMITSELIEDSVKNSVGKYMQTQKVHLSDKDVEEITSYVMAGVETQIDTSSINMKVTEIENLVKTSIQNLVDMKKYITVEDSKVKGEAEKQNEELKEHVNKKDSKIKEEVSKQNEKLKEYINERDSNIREEGEKQGESLKKYVDERDYKVEKEAEEQNEELKKYVDEKNSEMKKEAEEQKKDLREYADSSDCELEEKIYTYIDEEVVPPIVAIIEMNRNDIIEINKKIASLGKEYELYKENTNNVILNIQNTLNEYSEETTQNFIDVAEEMNVIVENHASFVENIDSKIIEVEEILGKKVSVSDFENFKKNYAIYKENVSSSIEAIEKILQVLEEKKADKTEVATLTNEFANLKNSYETFVSSDGEFANLTNRMTEVEELANGNRNDISALAVKTVQTETDIRNLTTSMQANVATLQNRVTELEESVQKSHPIGSLYISVSNENPASIFGGRWERIQDTFLMAAGNSYPAGTAGGSNSVTLNANQIPSLNITGTTAAKSGVASSSAGSYSGTVTSKGTYTGDTYTTNSTGEHTHGFGVELMGYNTGSTFCFQPDSAGISNLWMASSYTTVTKTGAAGSHKHNVKIPSQTITSSGNISIEGHTHKLNIPALSLTGKYTNNAIQSLNVTNKYLSVYVWKRVA